ncbi:hypothetical protein [Vreelandella hamiltonii]|uniref:Uncharacterized protein n=1 Tax=Halomonas johnsoniae TaxID=502832 RepID=A0ABQ2WAX8_9GAMM|nr:hypothetical protein [Halomonas johnsoniae]GGW45088.1 hypothetical protein GCM10007158_02110 [Halomonas johnsoniae]
MIEWMYNFAHLYIDLLKGVAWPLSVVFVVFLLKSRIASVFLKHNGTEVELKTLDKLHEELNASLRPVSDKMPSVAQKLQKQIDDLYSQAKIAVSASGKEIERGSNSFGSYVIYSNGVVVQSFFIKPRALKDKAYYHFPIQLSEVFSVLFVGEEVPVIVDLNNQWVVLKVSGENEGSIKVIIGGVR